MRRLAYWMDRYSRGLYDGPYQERPETGPLNIAVKLARQAAGGPPALVLDTTYRLADGASAQLTERCEEQLPTEKCRWQLTVTSASTMLPFDCMLVTVRRSCGTLTRVSITASISLQSPIPTLQSRQRT